MDNYAPPGQRPSGPAANKILKYLGVEGGIVLIVIIAIAIYFLNPFSNVNLLPKNSKTPPELISSSPVNKTISAQNNKITAPPIIVTIVLSDNGVNPSVASASAGGTVINISNNTINPVTIEFSGNLVPTAVIAPTSSWQSPTIATTGSFKYIVKGSNISGTINFK